MTAPSNPFGSNPPGRDDASLLADLQALLLKQERARVNQLEEEVAALQVEIAALQATIADVDRLVVPRIVENLGQITTDAVSESPQHIASALGPIIGEATRIQIRESRDEMIETLYPLFGELIVRAVAERFRDFQKQIDSRLRPPGSRLDNLRLRLQGLDPNEVALRRALPFEIQQIFLIQHETGLLLAHHATDDEAGADTDLISGMLTAIRDFVEDSLDPEHLSNEELDAIYHGDGSIILQYGTAAYVAVVIQGLEPTSFRASLRGLLTDLHLHYRHDIKTYDGDPENLPDLATPLREWETSLRAVEAAAEKRRIRRDLRRVRSIGGFLGVLGLLFCCFYAWFTWSLFPLALERLQVILAPPPAIPSATATASPTITSTDTATPRPTTTATSTLRPTVTPAPTDTSQPTATSTTRPSPTPRSTPTSVTGLITNSPVWSRLQPALEDPLYLAIPAGTPLEVLEVTGDWALVTWEDVNSGQVEGWIPAAWISAANEATVEAIETRTAPPVPPVTPAPVPTNPAATPLPTAAATVPVGPLPTDVPLPTTPPLPTEIPIPTP